MSEPFEAAKHVPFMAPGDADLASVGTTVPPAMARALSAAGPAAPAPAEEDYSGWLTVAEYAEQLGVAKGTCYNLVRRYVRTQRVFGRVLIDPVSAAEYKRRHDYTRRTPPPIAK